MSKKPAAPPRRGGDFRFRGVAVGGRTPYAGGTAGQRPCRSANGTMTELSTTGETCVARLVTDAATAQAVCDGVLAAFDTLEAAVATYEHDGRWAVEIYFDHPPDHGEVRGLLSRVGGPGAGAGVAFSTVTARDWVAHSLEGLAPVPAGRFVVHGAHDRRFVPANRIGIEIEAALAFGTGHHGTTRGCLLALDRLLDRRRPRRVLDIGCGTGVLAIAAARALRRRVVAGDIDAVSVAVARDNVRLNRAGAFVRVIRSDGLDDRCLRKGGPYDLVFANILLAPLVRLATPIRRVTAPGGRVVLSGLLAAQERPALAAWRSRGFRFERRVVLDGWVTLVVARL